MSLAVISEIDINYMLYQIMTVYDIFRFYDTNDKIITTRIMQFSNSEDYIF